LGLPAGVIPGRIIGPRGVEYWLSVQTDSSSLRYPSNDPQAEGIPIKIPNLQEPAEHPGGRYRLLSVPLDFGSSLSGGIDALLTDQLGAYNTAHWRLYEYDPSLQSNAEFLTVPAASFKPEPGRGFWLITLASHQVDTSPITGFSTPTGGDYPIALMQGWNLVGDPFDFPVAWSAVQKLPGMLDTDLRAYDGATGAYTNPTELEPFEGYFLYAPQAGNLLVPPVAAPSPAVRNDRLAAGGTRPAPVPIASNENSEDLWRCALRARTDHAADGSNTFGVNAVAKADLDPLDDMKPPPPPGPWVRVAFEHPDWHERSGAYDRDLRGPGTDGETWEIDVRSQTPGELVTLEIAELVPPPPSFALRLIDREQGSSADWLRAGPRGSGSTSAALDGDRTSARYRLMSFGPRPYRLAIVAGTEDYVARSGQQILAVPTRATLDPGAPNPFSEAARLRFGLPRAETVTLEIYNVLGQRVALPIDRRPLPPGYHAAIWDGMIAGGGRAPSGVYFLRLVAGPEVLTRRLVRVQ